MILNPLITMQLKAGLAVLGAFAKARWLQMRLRTRADLEQHQTRKMASWKAFQREAFGHLNDQDLAMDKAKLMTNFERYNQGRWTADQVRAALPVGQVTPGLSCGTSTGTSGQRGVYLITDAERYAWLGTILAKGLPEVWRQRQRVAVVLPQNSALYDAGNQSSWLKLAFFDLKEGPSGWMGPLEAFKPTVIIAPPKVLRWLAEHADLDRLKPRKIFAGAETLDPLDRPVIERAFELKLGQIYMATEGLLGVSCPQGSLHLTEDFVHFFAEPVSGETGLVTPLITDFSRRYQLMSSYRMNDLLRLRAKPCACGSPLRVVEEVVGRQDDCFQFADGTLVTPDVVRNAVLDGRQGITDFRVQQLDNETVLLRLPAAVSETEAKAAQAALEHQFARFGQAPEIRLKDLEQSDLFDRKLRRVERL